MLESRQAGEQRLHAAGAERGCVPGCSRQTPERLVDDGFAKRFQAFDRLAVQPLGQSGTGRDGGGTATYLKCGCNYTSSINADAEFENVAARGIFCLYDECRRSEHPCVTRIFEVVEQTFRV